VIALRAGQSPALLVCDPDFQVIKVLYFLFVLCLLVFGRVTLVHILFNYFLLSYSFSFLSLPSWGALSMLWLQDLQPNRILLITIHNPLYPITVDVLHQVFSPHGFVEKIVIFQKSAGQLSFRFCAAPCLSFSLLSLGGFWDIIDCFD
jgi:hypothetical protein